MHTTLVGVYVYDTSKRKKAQELGMDTGCAIIVDKEYLNKK